MEMKRSAQIVRAYEGCYFASFYLGGRGVWAGKRTDGQEYTTKSEARKEAKLWIAGKEAILPYTRFQAEEPIVANGSGPLLPAGVYGEILEKK